jgi:hypothetical protein
MQTRPERRSIIEPITSSQLLPTGEDGLFRLGETGAIPMLATSISGIGMSISFSTALARLLKSLKLRRSSGAPAGHAAAGMQFEG